MTPSARLAAAVELLTAIDAANGPAENEVSPFFRARRYAGSKDRRWISEFVYGCLRHRGELDWIITEQGGKASARLRSFLYLLRTETLSVEALADQFFSGPHGLTELSDEEKTLLAAGVVNDKEGMPAHAAGNFPEWISDLLSEQYGEQAGVIMESYLTRAPVTLRVNNLKTTREEAARLLVEAGVETDPTEISPEGLKLRSRTNLSRHPLLENGLIELQDEAAQISARLADVQPGHLVVDYCAGAGGKALAMAARMQNEGQIFALDIDARRMRDIAVRKRRASAGIIETVELSGDESDAEILDRVAEIAQRVFVDAPCSGSGTWRRQPDQKWKLTEERLSELCELQGGILEKAASLVAPGGRMIYATCSILKAENQTQVSKFLASHPEFHLLPVEHIWTACGLPGERRGEFLALTPADFGSDGFFTAVLEKTA